MISPSLGERDLNWELCLLPHPWSVPVPIRPEASHSCGEKSGVSTLNILGGFVFPVTRSFLAGGWRECTFPCGLLRALSLSPPEVAHLQPPARPQRAPHPLGEHYKGYQAACMWPSRLGLWYDQHFLSPLPSTVVVKMSDPGRYGCRASISSRPGL